MKNLHSLSIALASDHAGYALKQEVKQWLQERNIIFHDFGCYNTESCDYPDYAHPMAFAIERGEYDYGIAICSTGNGITMTVNHHPGIRAALCWDIPLARLARLHNNANVIGLPANFVSSSLALEMIQLFLTTEFEGGRHQRRIDKIPV